jgi:4-hydroxybenzoate polyprenyltransferase
MESLQSAARPSVLRQAADCLTEARPTVQIIYLLRYLCGVQLAAPGRLPDSSRLLVGAFGWSCSTIAVYLYNGVADLAEDTANGSRRPIASARLPVRSAARAAAGLAVTGLVCAASIGLAEAVLAAAYLTIGYLYSGPPFPLKRWPHTMSAAGLGLCVTTYWAGGMIGGSPDRATLLAFAAVMSLWTAGVGGISKELSDVEGDRISGRHTWPTVLGDRGARVLLALVATGIGATFCVVAWRYQPLLKWCAGTVAVGAVAVTAVGLAATSVSGERLERRRPYRVFMGTQHLAHLALLAVLWIPPAITVSGARRQ